MKTQILERIDQVAAAEWNALVPGGEPFLRHEWLAALERHGCVGGETGWTPCHVVCRDGTGRLAGAAPLYLKRHSHGEFVFDWSWAAAYRRCGLAYYPKLVGAVPYTPITGPRLLVAKGPARDEIAARLVGGAIEHAGRSGCSSLHWLFPRAEDRDTLARHGLMVRTGCQFHWHNRGYRDFDDFLDGLSAKRRKNIRRERRLARAAGVEIRVLAGGQLGEGAWRAVHRFYRDTFERHGNWAALNLAFFREIGEALGDRVVVVLALARGRPVAAAVNLRSDDALYGRYWGSDGAHEGLHFEACYYRGIEFCIQDGPARFEPGAQGEHKVWRGFLPALTYSAHWIAHGELRSAVREFLARETPFVKAYARELAAHSPFREAAP